MEPGSVTVEVDLYSGRPNPHFTLHPAQISELTSRLAALPATDDQAAPAPLGYRGLRAVIGPPRSGTEIRLYAGVATVSEPGGTWRRLSDADRAVERWLADLGADNLDQDEVSYLRDELGR